MSRRNRVVENESSDEMEVDDSDDSDSAEDYNPQKAARRSSKGGRSQQSKPGSSSQPISSQLSSQCSDLSEEEFLRCAALVANYFLAAECKKYPVKRADLGKVVGKQHVGKRLPLMIENASTQLQKVFGYKIVELQTRKNSFILLNMLSPAVNDTGAGPLSVPDSDEAEEEKEEDTGKDDEQCDEKQGLLFMILTVVFMMGNVVEEVTLNSFLKCLGVYVESKDLHPVFGNCKKLIEDYVKQCYLELTVLKDMEPPIRQYSWGERAHLQVCKRAVLEHVCTVYGGGLRPENWVDQWTKVVGSAASSSVGSSVEEISIDEPMPRASTSRNAK